MSAHYSKQLAGLQIGLSRMQRRLIAEGAKVLVIVEGRDAAGKDGAIKRIVEHMSPRDTRVVALGVPSEHDRRSWYFQRWCRHLPASGEIAIFNRSWYNRAGVERVMGFCSEDEYKQFIATVTTFEQLLEHSGLRVIKFYLDVSKKEQRRRLKDRQRDPLKQWKNSEIDQAAQEKWHAYSAARDEMLARTHTVFAPWTIIKADDKHAARLAVIRSLLMQLGEADEGFGLPDPNIAFLYDQKARDEGWLAR